MTPEELQELEELEALEAQDSIAAGKDPAVERYVAEDSIKVESDTLRQANKNHNILRAEDMMSKNFPLRSRYSSEPGKWAGKAVEGVGTAVDYFAGAPSRAGLEGTLSGGPVQGVKSFLSQYLKGPSQAPTGEQIIEKHRSRETAQPPSPFMTKALGLGIDIGADWSNVLPVGKLVGGVFDAAKWATNKALKYGAKGVDAATDTRIATKTGKAIKEGAKEYTESVKHVFSGERAKDWPEMQGIAKRNRINSERLPASVEYGPDSQRTWNEKVAGEGHKGEALRINHQDRAGEVNRAVARDIKKIAGGKDPLDNLQGGEMLRTNFDNHVNVVFDDISVRYDDITRNNPGLFIEDEAFTKLDRTLNAMKRKTQRMIKRGVTDEKQSQGTQLLRYIDNIEKGNGSYKQSLESLRDIGEVAFSTPSHLVPGPKQSDMRDLYHALKESLLETADYVEPELAVELRKSNKKLSELIGDKNELAKIIRNTSRGDEQIFKTILGNSAYIKSLKKFFPKEDLQRVKGAYLNRMHKVSIDEKIGYRTMFNKLRDSDVRTTLFDNEEELRNFTDLLRFGDRLGVPHMSTSFTGASNALRRVTTEPANRALNVGLSELTEQQVKKPKSKFKKIVKNPRSKAAQVYSVQQRNEDE